MHVDSKRPALRGLIGAVFTVFIACGPAVAAIRTWNNTGTDFNTGANWTGGLPGTGDFATFSNAANPSYQPSLSAPLSVAGLHFVTNVGSGYILTGSSALTLLSVNSAAASYAIRSMATSGTNVIDVPLVFGGGAGSVQYISQVSAGTLRFLKSLSETGAGTVLKLTGNGTYELYASNSISGGFQLNATSLKLNLASASALGTGNLAISNSPYLDNITGAPLTLTGNNPIQLNAPVLTFPGSADLNMGTGAVTIVGGTRAIRTDGGKLTLGGRIGEDAPGRGLTKDGIGTLILDSTNSTYSGPTSLISGGGEGTSVLEIRSVADGGQDSAIGRSGAAASNLVINSGNTLRYTGPAASTDRLLTLANGTLGCGIDASGSGPLQFTNTNPVTHGGNLASTRLLRLSGTNTDENLFALSLGNTATTNSGLIKTNGGRWIVTGTNTYLGDTIIAGGVLQLGSATALPGGIGAAGGTSLLYLNGGVLGLGIGPFQRATGSGSLNVRFNGNGGFAAYGADRTVNLGGASATATWGSGNFVPTNATLLLGASSSDAMLDFQNPVALAGAPRTVQVGDGTADADARLSGVLSGTGLSGLTKTGAGTLELTGANTYAGGTTVAAGRLWVNGKTTGQSNYVVTAGGTLGGTGMVGLAAGRTVTIEAGGTIAPGAGDTGALTVNGGFVIAENALVDWTYDSGTATLVAVSGNLQLPAAATVTVHAVSGARPKPAVLFTAGTLSGASTLAGWTVTGGSRLVAAISGTTVVLLDRNPGALVLIR